MLSAWLALHRFCVPDHAKHHISNISTRIQPDEKVKENKKQIVTVPILQLRDPAVYILVGAGYLKCLAGDQVEGGIATLGPAFPPGANLMFPSSASSRTLAH